MALSLVDNRGIDSFGIGDSLFCDLRLELASLDIDPGSVESRAAASFGGGTLDLDAELSLCKKTPAGTFFHRKARQLIDVVLLVGKKVVDEFDKFAGYRNDRDVVISLSLDAGVKRSHRPGRAAEYLGGFDDQPAGLGTALFCDAAVA